MSKKNKILQERTNDKSVINRACQLSVYRLGIWILLNDLKAFFAHKVGDGTGRGLVLMLISGSVFRSLGIFE